LIPQVADDSESDEGVVQVRFSRYFLPQILGLVLCITATACGQKDVHVLGQKNLSIACGQPNQYSSYMNPLDVNQVVTVQIDSQFTNQEQNRIHDALNTWNQQAQITGKIMFQVVENAVIAANSVPANLTDCSYLGGAATFSIVKITNPQQWEDLGLTANNPGVTFRCASGGNYVSRQVVLINPQFADINKLEAVALHEIGHAYGMDHSCDFQNRGLESWLSCTGLSTSHAYRDSAMYPVIESIGGGLYRTTLSNNDKERSACVMNYQP
jgi:hypothetical protein